MSCEYELQAIRGEVHGILCSLTGRGCYTDQDKPYGHTCCIRRTWANDYVRRNQDTLSQGEPWKAKIGRVERHTESSGA